MKLPITQEHIDEAKKRIEQRRLNPVNQPKRVIVKSENKIVQKKKHRKYIPKRDNFDKMMDYAIWKDKD